MASHVPDIATFLTAQNAKGQLRFITCGSVDDGKSTLIGRLLHDSQAVLDDQLAAAQSESRKYGTQGDAVDLALLVDGLQAEREQGITIDVAYRYFETERRKFIAADTPGHEQYTRNMATGASNAELAVILVDARHGLQTQTRRHSFIVSLFGIRHVVLAVNKMDLLNYDEATFTAIADDYRAFARDLGISDVHCVPISALTGENVFTPAKFMAWYDGPSLMELLETVDVAAVAEEKPFRMPVQWVNRPNAEFRGFSGTISSGEIAVGDAIEALDSNRTAHVARVVGPSGDQERAVNGQAVTLVLDRNIDISRGDVLAAPGSGMAVADQFAAHIVWMSDTPMLPERAYTLRLASASATAQVTDLVHHVDVNTLDKLAAKTLQLNEVGYCKIALDRAIAFDPYVDNRQTGGFILIDKLTNHTVAAGTVDFALRRASNIVWHDMKIDKVARAAAAGQKPCVLWFTGLSGSGKSTVADRLEQKLHAAGRRTYLLDGDNVRHGLNKDLGFTDQDR
ncbi:MAG: sulfate adenylyltransferase subunit CysN, partial [Pseudomonadota bacterium]